MTPSSSMKVRMVRCPRCRGVLEELPDIPVYRCGGCGTILQAKHSKMEANNTVNYVTKIQQDSVPEKEEARNSNLYFPGPPLEESSPDKDDMGFQDVAEESSSEQSEYRSAYNGLFSSPEFSHDTGECSLLHDSQIYDSKLHDSDEDSTGGGNFSGEYPSSAEASERVKVCDNIYLEPSTKVDQSDGEQSPKVWQGGENFLDEVRIFYGCEDQDSRWQRVDTELREGINDNYAHLEHDSVTENKATSSNHDLTSPPEREFSSDKESRKVSIGLLSMPGAGHCQYEDSKVEESVIHDEVKCCLRIDSKRYVRELHDSDGESITDVNFSGEIPSSSELIYQGIDEFATEAKHAGKDEKIYSDQPTKCEDVEFPDHEDQDNGWPPVIGQHMEEMCNYNLNLENNDVLPEAARSSKHCLGCRHKEDFLPDKDSIRYHDEHVDSSSEQSVLSEDRSISNGLLSLPEAKFFENKDTDEYLDHDDSQDMESSNGGLLDLGEDEESFLDGPKKVRQFDGGESLRMCQKSDNIVQKVQNIFEHEAPGNGLSIFSTEHREGTNNHVHLEHDDVSREVAGINNHCEGINNNHVHLENDDILKEMAGSLNHDSTSPLEEELLLDKANIQFQNEHVESRMDFAVVRIVSNDLSISPQINSSHNEDPLMEEYLNKDHDINSLAPDFKRHDNGLHDLDGKFSGGENLSGEIRSSTELVYHETEELIPEAIEHAKECNKSNLDQPTKVEPVQVENSLQVCPEDDNILHEVQNFSGHEETRCSGVLGSSAAETVSHEDGDASPIDNGFKGSPTFNRANTNNPSVGDTVVASQVVSVGRPVNLTSLDGKYVDRSPRKGSRNFGSASSVEFVGDSLFSETSPERRVKPRDTISPLTTRGYYAYDGSDSSNDETDGQIPVYIPHSSRRKGKEVGYSSTTLKREGFAVKNMMSSEPEMEYWAPSPSNRHHAVTGSYRNSDEFAETKSHILTSGNAIRLNEGGSSPLPLTSRNLQANQKLGRPPSVHRNNLPPLHPGFHSPDKTSRSEPDKMDLLRTVCELKDQLNRIQFPKISRDGRFPTRVMREAFSPSLSYYDHLAPGRDRGVDLNHHGNYRWYDQEKGRFERSNVSALALSGEAAYYRHQVNCSCLNCRTPNWHSSAPLLPHSLHFNDSSVAPTGHNPHNISGPLNSQNYSSYECLVSGHETMSDNQNRINNEMRRFYSNDKYHASKRHLRPVAGGSPFVTCYHCSETLQLPADFLVFRKRYHQLRCNACSKVLKYSLGGGKHIVPYRSRGREVGNSIDATTERSLLVTPHSNFCKHGEPVSCSDEYGPSFCRSCSTEGEALVTVPSSGLVKRNMYTRMISSVSSYEAMEDRNMKSIMKNSMEKAKNKNKKNNSVETSKSSGTSSQQPKFVKPSSEIEELPPPSISPLHRLMGYSSISQVLKKGRT